MDYKITKIEITDSGLIATGEFDCGIDASFTMDDIMSISVETFNAVNEFFRGMAKTFDVTMNVLEGEQ